MSRVNTWVLDLDAHYAHPASLDEFADEELPQTFERASRRAKEVEAILQKRYPRCRVFARPVPTKGES